ncbi:AAA family ATPase [Curtobacterium pusillum]|uniref:AAA family ATPase n=1 Tax=Curtobacterium pusillum TaxID=69373 RepID=A0ABX2MFK5_9MICO|nr:AAA family ATPase [Curtobacterium pusillum]NUU14456.1 AAA family ATPase [Curtobacterium pusillum]GLK30958.1 ABC transporter, ATP-binding protein [Curtobacterium pusillum]
MPRTRLPIRRVEEYAPDPLVRERWPGTLAPVRQLLDDGLDLDPVTVFVGDNGVGKSTLVEAIALAFGMGPEGGSTMSGHSTRPTESQLWEHLVLVREPGASKGGFFLRAETMHGLFTFLEEHPGARPEPRFHERSHGESFLDFVIDRSRWPGLWILDEPESALSFSGCLALIGLLQSIVDSGLGQVVLSTHSPVLAAFPGATIHEVGEWGLRRAAWGDLDLVRNQRAFLEAPERYLRHLA